MDGWQVKLTAATLIFSLISSGVTLIFMAGRNYGNFDTVLQRVAGELESLKSTVVPRSEYQYEINELRHELQDVSDKQTQTHELLLQILAQQRRQPPVKGLGRTPVFPDAK